MWSVTWWLSLTLPVCVCELCSRFSPSCRGVTLSLQNNALLPLLPFPPPLLRLLLYLHDQLHATPARSADSFVCSQARRAGATLTSGGGDVTHASVSAVRSRSKLHPPGDHLNTTAGKEDCGMRGVLPGLTFNFRPSRPWICSLYTIKQHLTARL